MDAIFYTGLYALLWLLAPRGHALDCQHAQALCNEERSCAYLLSVVPDKCGESGSKTTCDAPQRSECEGILQLLQQKQQFRGCTCDPLAVNYQECRAIFSRLYMEQCTVTDEESVEEVPSTRPPVEGSTCMRALETCNADATCRRRLYAYLTACRGDPGADICRRAACRQSIRAFLDDVSPRYTHALLYCYCASNDRHCDAVWRGLNAECAYQLTPVPSCLAVKEKCLASPLCSTNFENYKLQCAVSDATGTGCAQSYGACRDARLGILGTVVAVSCTCRGEEGAPLRACQQQQLAVLDNPCFARASQAYYPSANSQDGARTTAQPQIHVNKRVKEGCVVRLWVGYPDVHVAMGHHIRIASDDSASCTQVCRCETGYLSHCFDVLCNVTQPCDEGTPKGHEGSDEECVCTGQERVCIDKKTSPDVGFPAVVIGYSVMERDFMQRQLHVTVTTNSIVSMLQHALAGIFSRKPCELQAVIDTNVNDTHSMVIAAHPGHNVTQNYWECVNQLSDLAAMINTRAPPIASDVTLSVIKIAGLIEGAPEQERTRTPVGYARSSSSTRVAQSCVISQLVSFVLVALKMY